jgi:serine/threonine protein phosphatase PrpC
MSPASVTVTAATSRGLHRVRNEDTVGAFGWIAPDERRVPVQLSARSAEPLVVAVADGVGGHKGGHVASSKTLRMLLEAEPTLTSCSAVESILRATHAALLRASAAEPDLKEMGTTVVAVIVTTVAVLCAHVGDSRIYYVEEGILDQLTEDDTGLVEGGPLTQCLGGLPGVEMHPHVQSFPRDVRARYLLCSDGLHGQVARDTIRELAWLADPFEAVGGLIDAAFAAGAADNVSVCLVDVDATDGADR